MPEGDEEKAAKVAAARKRVEELKRQKAKKAASLKTTSTEDTSNNQTNSAVQTEAKGNDDTTTDKHATATQDEASNRPEHESNASSATVSKSRSESFRRTSVSAAGPLSPTGAKPDSQAMSEIYRRQSSKLEDLEKENKRLQKDADAGNTRWQKLEGELEELREKYARVSSGANNSSSRNTDEIKLLREEIDALKRQNSQLQNASKPRSMSTTIGSPDLDLKLDLEAKNKTIEAMETELSRSRLELRSHVDGATRHQEQVQALEGKLDRAEKAANLAQKEAADLRKNLTRLSEKNVKEGTQIASAETKVRSLERELEARTKQHEEDSKRIAMLEAKFSALTNLQKESEARRLEAEKAKRAFELETEDLRRRLEKSGREDTVRQMQTKGPAGSGVNDDDKLEELEAEDRSRLERKIRELEAELTEVKRGVWRDRRRELQPQLEPGHLSATDTFENIDLSGRGAGSGTLSSEGTNKAHYPAGPGVGLVSAITNSFMNFTNADNMTNHASLIEDDFEFDSDAFVKAREDEAKERLERIRETKRGLMKWKGFKLDLVQQRLGSDGLEVFEI